MTLVKYSFWVTAFGLAVCGCRGNSNSGHFDIEPRANVALHGRLPLSISRHYGEGAVMLSDVIVDTPSAVSVTGSNQDGEMLVSGLKVASEVNISFTGNTDTGREADSFSLDVAEVENLYFWKGCEDGVFFRGELAGLPYEFNLTRGTPVEGLDVYPFEVIPKTGLKLQEDASTLREFVFLVPNDAPTSVSVSSTLSGDKNAEESKYVMRIVDPSPMQLFELPATTGREHGNLTLGLSLKTDDGKQVCSRFHKRVVSRSPSVCALGDDGASVLDTFENSVEVNFVGFGTCALEVYLPELGIQLPLPSIQVEDVDESLDTDWD